MRRRNDQTGNVVAYLRLNVLFEKHLPYTVCSLLVLESRPKPVRRPRVQILALCGRRHSASPAKFEVRTIKKWIRAQLLTHLVPNMMRI